MNADADFDTKEFISLCERKGIVPNVDFNKRNGVEHTNRSYAFDNDMYRKRFVVERTNAWIDNFRTLLIRHERKAKNWLQFHHLAFLILFLQKFFNIQRTF